MAFEHPERALVRRAIEQKLTGLPVTTNPLAISLNMRIHEARDGWVRIAFNPPEGFTQGNGVVQGGIISAMLDFGMIFAAFSMVPVDATVADVSDSSKAASSSPSFWRNSGEFAVISGAAAAVR